MDNVFRLVTSMGQKKIPNHHKKPVLLSASLPTYRLVEVLQQYFDKQI